MILAFFFAFFSSFSRVRHIVFWEVNFFQFFILYAVIYHGLVSYVETVFCYVMLLALPYNPK